MQISTIIPLLTIAAFISAHPFPASSGPLNEEALAGSFSLTTGDIEEFGGYCEFTRNKAGKADSAADEKGKSGQSAPGSRPPKDNSVLLTLKLSQKNLGFSKLGAEAQLNLIGKIKGTIAICERISQDESLEKPDEIGKRINIKDKQSLDFEAPVDRYTAKCIRHILPLKFPEAKFKLQSCRDIESLDADPETAQVAAKNPGKQDAPKIQTNLQPHSHPETPLSPGSPGYGDSGTYRNSGISSSGGPNVQHNEAGGAKANVIPVLKDKSYDQGKGGNPPAYPGSPH